MIRLLKFYPPNLYAGFFLFFLGSAFAAVAYSFISQTGTYLGAAGGLATMSGVMIALRNQEVKDAQDRSKFFLEQSLIGIKESLDLIRNSNDRIIWVSAARILAGALQVRRSITEESHETVFNIRSESLRHDCYQILNIDETTVAASYWLGSPLGTDQFEAMRESTKPKPSLFGNSISDLHYIPESAMAVFVRFCTFPTNYLDPIMGVRLTQTEMDALEHHLPQVRHYLSLHDEYHMAFGDFEKWPPAVTRSRKV